MGIRYCKIFTSESTSRNFLILVIVWKMASDAEVIDWDEAMQQCGDDEEFLRELLDDLRSETDTQVEKMEEVLKVIFFFWNAFPIWRLVSGPNSLDGLQTSCFPDTLTNFLHFYSLSVFTGTWWFLLCSNHEGCSCYQGCSIQSDVWWSSQMCCGAGNDR